MLIYSGQDSSLWVLLLVHLLFPRGLTASENHSENMCTFSPVLPQPCQPPLTEYTKDSLWRSLRSRALGCRTAQGVSVLHIGHVMANLAVIPPTWIMVM